MPSQDIGDLAVKISLDNSGFSKGMSLVNKNLSLINSEFKMNTAALGTNGKGYDSLTLKAEKLVKTMDNQKLKIDVLSAAYDRSVKATGADSVASQNLELKLNKAKTSLSNMGNELNKTNKDIEAETSALDKAENKLITTSKELDVQNNKWNVLSKTLNSMSAKLKTIGEGFSSIGKKMSVGITAPVVGLMTASVKLASDLNESMNKIDVCFGKNAAGVKTWSDTTLKSFGIAKGTALDMASNYGDMAVSMGLPTSSAATMAEKLSGLAGDLASFKNIGIGEANTALSSVFTGETESLKELGIVMTQNNLQDFATSKGIKTKIADMTQAQQTQLRYNFVMNATKTAQGDFARTSTGTANASRIFTESLKELGEVFGQNILPVITPIIIKLTELIQSFGKLSPSMQKTILVVASIAAVIGPVLVVIGTLITSVSAIAGVFAGASTAIAAAGGMLAILTGPIGIAIVAITLIVAIGYELVKNWDSIKAGAAQLGTSISNTWNNIKSAVVSKVDEIKTKASESFANMKIAIQNKVFEIKTAVVNKFNEIMAWFGALPGRMSNYGSSMMNSLNSGISNTIGNIRNTISNGINNAISFITSLPSRMAGYGRDMIQGLVSGITGMIGSVASAAGNIASTIASYIHFSTPDTGDLANYETFMPDFMGGLAKGIQANKSKVVSAMKSLSTDMSVNVNPNTSAALKSNTVSNNYGSVLHVDTLTIAKDMDIKTIAESLNFYMKQNSTATGGAY